jgi:hypothetical protein
MSRPRGSIQSESVVERRIDTCVEKNKVIRIEGWEGYTLAIPMCSFLGFSRSGLRVLWTVLQQRHLRIKLRSTGR